MYVAENVPLIFAQDVELYRACVSVCLYVTWSDLTVNYGRDCGSREEGGNNSFQWNGQAAAAIINGNVDLKSETEDAEMRSPTRTLAHPYPYPTNTIRWEEYLCV